jgi:hypothetical protein
MGRNVSLGDDMPAPYSGDLRQRVAAAVAEGAFARSAAGRFGISVSTAIRCGRSGDHFPPDGRPAAMGLETDIGKLRAKGWRPLLVGAGSWLFISALSLVLIKIAFA